MLEAIRKGTQTIYAKIIIILIVASFSVWGIGGIFQESFYDEVIIVGDYKISQAEFESELTNTKNFYKEYYGDYF